ncbi:MAG: hypothetical protein WD009_05670, partial [Phycisphaeraceae bacterium]
MNRYLGMLFALGVAAAFAGLAVTLAVAAVRQFGARRVAMWLGSAAGVFVLVVALLGALWLTSSREVVVDGHTTVQTQPMYREVPADSVASAGGGNAWAPEVNETFNADIYPSPEHAARALARWAAAQLQDPSVVDVTTAEPRVDAGTVAAFAEALRGELSGATVRVEGDPPRQPGDAPPRVQLVLVSQAQRPTPPAAWGEGEAQHSGTLHATMSTTDRRDEAAAAFIDKPWVAEPSAFLSGNPARRWVIGRSPRFADSEAEALAMAQAAARTELLSRVAADTREATAAAVVRIDEFVADRFVQRLSRRYGHVWRAAVLVDASSDVLASLERSVKEAQVAEAEARAHERRSWAGNVVSIAGLVGV